MQEESHYTWCRSASKWPLISFWSVSLPMSLLCSFSESFKALAGPVCSLGTGTVADIVAPKKRGTAMSLVLLDPQ